MLRALASLEGQAGLVGRNLYAGSIANQVVIVHAIRALTSTHLRGEGGSPPFLSRSIKVTQALVPIVTIGAAQPPWLKEQSVAAQEAIAGADMSFPFRSS